MNKASFWRLVDILEPHLKTKKRKRGATPNGDILPSLRVSMAIRYFAGGDSVDIAPLHGVPPNEVLSSVDKIINAVHRADELSIHFPEHYNDQQRVADAFKRKSAIGFGNCVGAIDGILVWTNKPTSFDLNLLGFGPKKFFCGRKNKYGLNMQGICDADGRFLDYKIRHPGATADYLAFTTSSIFDKIQKGSKVHQGHPFLKPGLSLYGDNAYVNSDFMSVPFRAVTSGPKDAYNFFQSQLRINIECAFGMLVHRFGILRKPMPVNFTIQKSCALVGCLCKLHNYCINEKENNKPLRPMATDLATIVSDGGFSLQRFDINEEYSYDTVLDRINPLLDGGQHFDDVSRPRCRGIALIDYPSQVMLRFVHENGFKRPVPRGSRNGGNT